MSGKFNKKNMGRAHLMKSQGEIESDKMKRESIINRIDKAIFESEQELENRSAAVDAKIVFAELEKRLR